MFSEVFRIYRNDEEITNIDGVIAVRRHGCSGRHHVVRRATKIVDENGAEVTTCELGTGEFTLCDGSCSTDDLGEFLVPYRTPLYK